MNQEQEPNQIALTSPDGREARLEVLRRLFPDLFDREGALDEKALRQLVAEETGHVTERFRFEWAGKAQSKRFAFAPSKATLVYDPERSVNADGTPNKAGETLAENTSQNLLIEGDNLEVLKLLQASYFEQVKCIYIDPPYNKDADVIYPDDYSEDRELYWEKEGIKKEGVRLVSVSSAEGRKHSNWLNIIQSRLFAARNMLTSDGAIFISIGNDEEHHLRMLCDQVFGAENFVEKIIWNKRIPKNDAGIGNVHEYILVYVKDKGLAPKFTMPKNGLDEVYDFVGNLKKKGLSTDRAQEELKKFYVKKGFDRGITLYSELDADFNIWGKINMNWPNTSTSGEKYEVLHPKLQKPVKIPDRGWRWKRETLENKLSDGPVVELSDGSIRHGRIWFDKDEKTQPSGITYLHEVENMLLRSVVSMKSNGGVTVEDLIGQSVFSNPKPVALISTIIESIVKDGDVVFDFFAGSGTTFQSCLSVAKEKGISLNSISVQIPEKIAKNTAAKKSGFDTVFDITLERARKVSEKFSEENSTEQDVGFRVLSLHQSHFPQNTFTPNPEKTEAENINALEDHLASAAQLRLFGDDEFHGVVTEIALKNGFGLFYTLEGLGTFTANAVYRLTGNEKGAILCLDGQLDGATIEALKDHSDEQLIVLKAALNTTEKFELQTVFQDNLWVV